MPSDRSILDFIGTFPEKDEEDKEEKSPEDGFASFVKSIPKDKTKESKDKQRLDSARRQLEESWSSDARSIMVGMGAPIVSMIERLTGQGERASEMSRVNSAIQQAAKERDPEGVAGLAKRGLRGALQNIPPMILAGRAGGPAGVIGYYAAQEANEAITTGQDAGLKGKALARYAIEKGAIEGGITAAFQKVGLGGAESVAGGKLAASSGVKSALKRLGFGTIAELGEENTIALVGAVADKFRGVDPDALNLENIASSAAEVSATTLWTMGLIEGPNVVRSAKNSKMRAEITKHAKEGKVPSRKTWKSWGLPVDLGKNEELRKTATNSMAENFQNEGKQVLESIQAEAQQPEAAEVAELPPQVTPGTSVGVDATEGTVLPTGSQAVPSGVQEDTASPRLEAQQAAEEARPDRSGFLKEETGAKPIDERLGEVKRADVIGDPSRQYTKGGKVDLSMSDPVVERRTTTRLARESISEKIKRFGARGWAFVSRPQPLLPKEDRFIFAQETIRLLKAVPQMASDEAIRTVAAIVDPLGPKQEELLQRSILVNNQLRSIKKNQPLRFGWTEKGAKADKKKIDALVEATPIVKNAIETRQRIVNETVGKLVEKNLIPESTLQNTEDFFHQQVSMFQEAKGKAGSASTLTKKKKSFQKKRVEGRELGEEYDPNPNYIESETEWLADAFSELRKKELFDNLMERYDITSDSRDAAKANGVTLEDYVRDLDGYDLMQPEPGNVFYQAYSIPERIGEKLQQEVIKEHNLTKDEVRQVLALGGKHQSFVLPTDLVNQLESMETKDNAHWVKELHRKAMGAWKGWTLLWPKRVLAYNFRNFTGDMSAAFAGNPQIIKRMPAAVRELMKYHHGRIKISDNMRLARDTGVIGAGFFGSEVEETSEMQIFRRLKPVEQRKLLRNPARVYMEIIRPNVEMRENTLRYAAFLESLDEIKSGGISHYGAAKKINVETIAREMGGDVAAAHVSRELIGDYGNLTEAGEFLRRNLFPFWAFQEINLKRYPRLVINAIQSGQGRGRTAAVISAAAMLRIGAGYGALWTWNNLLIPAMFGGEDLEDELGSYDKANPHIVLGKNPDGSVRVFRNVGALGDFLEWFGINEALTLWDEYKAGQVGVADVAKEMAKAPIEKVIGALRPDMKAGYELTTGQSLFPSPFHPRSIDKGEAIPNVFGLGDEYRWAKGLVIGEGNRARTNYWQRWLVGVVDPRQTALGEMYDSRRRFLESKGVREGGVYPISEYKQAREAAASENYDAFVEWKKAFVAKHGQRSWKKFKAFRGRLDPIASRLSEADEIEFEYEYLDAGQRRKLQMVRDYAWELDVRLLLWWEASAQKAPRPEEPEWMRRSE